MTSHSILKVMVADDHPLYRAGLRELLEEAGMSVVSEAASGQDAVREAVRTRPDVVVMDVRMPVMDGIEASGQITRRLPRTEIVMVSGIEEDGEQLLKAVASGARSYVRKGEDPSVIVEAVRSVSQGRTYLPPGAVQLLMEGLRGRAGADIPGARSSDERLSLRQKQVLQLLARGCHNQEIADELGLSVRAVGNQLAKIYHKLHLHRRTEAVKYAIAAGLASTELDISPSSGITALEA